MPVTPPEIASPPRDGTSQAARANPDLDPATIVIDERSTRDLLAFACEHAKELLYYNEQNKRSCNWAGFFAGLQYDDVISFLGRPEDYVTDQSRALRRPHFVLFLAWLSLLGVARDAMNGLTRRHLDFYFRDVLRLVPKPAVPDRVFVLFELAAGTDAVEVPEGTALAAGRDSAGRNRIYTTERALIVNRAKVARLASLFTDKRIIGMTEARQASVGTKEEHFMAMLSLALGDPSPGDPLPLYDDNQPVTYSRLKQFAQLVEFAPSSLWLELFELRNLVARKRTRDHADADWNTINAILQKAGQKKRNDPSWTFSPANPRDFDANLAAALGGIPDFAGLPEIQTVDDLYTQRDRLDVQKAITDKLYLSLDDFVAMMDLKRAADADWRVINSRLQLAGQRKRRQRNYRLTPADPSAFATNLNAAIGPVDFKSVGVSDIDSYADAISELENYFFMPAEHFDRMMKAAESQTNVSEREWETIQAYLAEAHRQKVFAPLRDALRQARKKAGDNEAEGFRAILAVALGETASATVDVLFAKLEVFVDAEELKSLRNIEKKTSIPDSVTDAQWEATYDILERAQRKREQLPDPLAQKEEWVNLYAYPDATAVKAPSAASRTDEPVRWKVFGAAPSAQSEDMPPPRELGIAIASPLFGLSVGDRQIVLTLAFYKDGDDGKKGATSSFQDDKTPLAVELSTAKGWVEPTLDTNAVDYAKLADIVPVPEGTNLFGLELRLTLQASDPPIEAPPIDQRVDGCPWPMARITLRPIWRSDENRFTVNYPRMRTLRLARVHLRSAVGNYVASDAASLTPLVVENDSGPIDGKRPFEPFGAAPESGATLSLSHPDLLRKPLRSLRFRLDWMGGPANLNGLYAAYGLTEPFTVNITQVDHGFLFTTLTTKTKVFESDQQDATKPHVINIDIPAIHGSWQPYDMPSPAPLDVSVTGWPRYLRWELFPVGFQHREYSALVASKSMAFAAAMANIAARKTTDGIDPKDYAVGQPYTPKLKSLRLDFVAEHEVLLEEYQSGPESDQIFHVHPFGYAEAVASTPGQGFPFLPSYDNEGELYIGITDLKPPQTLSLLFQMAEGSANPDVESRPVTWSVLDADGWRLIAGEAILREDTRGLINSGLIEFALPETEPDTRLPSGYFWLRASVESGVAGVCDAFAIEAQATSARYLDGNGAPDHYLTPLPPSSITAPVTPVPGIASVRQPFTSFGARPAEEVSRFYTAASERLRHKQRAITPWDYERIVLRHFPEVYKTKCLPSTLGDDPGDGATRALGLVRLVIIPDIRGRSLFDPFEPKASLSLLADIAAYLGPLLPNTARLRVVNAAYVQVRVRVGVRFIDQNNPSFYMQRLNDDLNRYLAPWAYDEGADIIIGQRIYANSVVNFIDERPYVDYVAGINLFRSDDEGDTFQHVSLPGPDDVNEGYFVSSEDSTDAVLVGARQHDIDLIGEEVYKPDEFKGLNYMKVELDFVVG